MKVVITALLSFFLLIQSALAADVELNTLRILINLDRPILI